MIHSPDLSIIIVNFNTRDYLARCLESLSGSTEFDCEIIVVDNASADASVEMVQERFPQVTVIANPNNVGFARANNQAIAMSKGRYHYFLNPDAEVRPGALTTMI